MRLICAVSRLQTVLCRPLRSKSVESTAYSLLRPFNEFQESHGSGHWGGRLSYIRRTPICQTFEGPRDFTSVPTGDHQYVLAVQHIEDRTHRIDPFVSESGPESGPVVNPETGGKGRSLGGPCRLLVIYLLRVRINQISLRQLYLRNLCLVVKYSC